MFFSKEFRNPEVLLKTGDCIAFCSGLWIFWQWLYKVVVEMSNVTLAKTTSIVNPYSVSPVDLPGMEFAHGIR